MLTKINADFCKNFKVSLSTFVKHKLECLLGGCT